MNNQLIQSYRGISPKTGQRCFIAATAVVIGDVVIGDDTSIWYGVSIRGDENFIRIGNSSNIQDNAVCHVTKEIYPLQIGNFVTIGHGAVVHGCTVQDHCLIGMNATVLDGAHVGEGCIIAANALVPIGMEIPARTMVAGVPAVIKKELSSTDIEMIDSFAENYLELKEYYLQEGLQ